MPVSIGLGKQPANLVDSNGREAVALAFDEPFLRHRLESIGRGIFGGDPCALFLQRRIDPLGNLLLGFVAPDTRLREGWPLSSQEWTVHP